MFLCTVHVSCCARLVSFTGDFFRFQVKILIMYYSTNNGHDHISAQIYVLAWQFGPNLSVSLDIFFKNLMSGRYIFYFSVYKYYVSVRVRSGPYMYEHLFLLKWVWGWPMRLLRNCVWIQSFETSWDAQLSNLTPRRILNTNGT